MPLAWQVNFLRDTLAMFGMISGFGRRLAPHSTFVAEGLKMTRLVGGTGVRISCLFKVWPSDL